MILSIEKRGWALLLGIGIVACGPSVPEGDDVPVDEQLACTPDAAPIACVGENGEGCLVEPRGEATCVAGRWQCAIEWTAPRVDSEEYCTVPPVEDCEGEPVVCTNQSASGECGDYWVDAYAFCIDGQWQCPPGYHDDDVHCEWPQWPDEPTEPMDPPEPPTSQCTAGEDPPAEWADCYDQGPGECADATRTPDCVSGEWVCPAGWAFGGYGAGCSWPGE